mgnify:CR=1 FL=1
MEPKDYWIYCPCYLLWTRRQQVFILLMRLIGVSTRAYRNICFVYFWIAVQIPITRLYTAHDVNLIDLNSFSQDEIWFVEKKLTGETTIKPMSDFDINEDRDVLKAYLNGRFGAVPVIKGGNGCS